MKNVRSARGRYATSEVTRLKLIASAEKAVAQHGIGGASAREVSKAAGLSNTAAVSYHFGSMGDLLKQVLVTRMEQMDEIRAILIEENGTPLSECAIQTLVEYICLPHVIFAKMNEGRTTYQSFVCQYLPHIYPNGSPWSLGPDSASSPNMSRIALELKIKMRDLPDEIFNRRMFNIMVLFCNFLRTLPPSSLFPPNIGEASTMIGDTIAQCTALLCATSDVPKSLRSIILNGDNSHI